MDQIAAMLTKIRNAQKAGHSEVKIKASKLKLAIAKILEREGFLKAVSLEKEGNFDVIIINLKYRQISNIKKVPAIETIRRVSHSGQRIYVKSDEIRRVRNGYGIGIISTSRGIMTNEESRKLGLGGEYICEVW
jgi:small subunit ribosomal protein S8